MVDAFIGKSYKLETSENFDEFMSALGVGLVSRKLANAASPVLTLTKEGDEYVIASKNKVSTILLKFKPGVEFDQKTADGRNVKSTLTIDGNVIHEVQKLGDGKEAVIERYFSASEVKIVMKVDNIQATRIYKVQA